MEISKLFVQARSATVQIADGGLYHTKAVYQLFLNGQAAGAADTAVTSLYDLQPETEYVLSVRLGAEEVGQCAFRTARESYTLNVRQFGAVGDGVHDDTAAIQAAILHCPADGRVLIPAGRYHVLPLMLKSHVRIELRRGATLLLETDRSKFPILPGMILSTDETDDLNLGSWEGNPLDMYAAFISGMDVEDVVLYGEGVLDGQGDKSDWWQNCKVRRGAWRPRMLFLNHCKNVTVQGVTFQNSPSWNLQPYFSKDLRFLNIRVNAPANSPNTDGFDPESCDGILLAGAHFSLGDDCIALKSGKLYMGQRYKTPCQHIEISHCLMENGHGGMTCGSEMAGGIAHVRLHDCLMRNTDRGLRVKTRRGRGNTAVIDGLVFRNVEMRGVKAPFVINMFYFCDPDGHGPYVQCRDAMPVDEYTPKLGSLTMEDIVATDAQFAGCYFDGLPEQPIERVSMKNVTITFDPNAEAGQAAMADNRPLVKKLAIYAENVKSIQLHNVKIEGYEGERLRFANVGHFEED